jgi:raffinose/stachyose/melibiose transport system permease protein
MLFTATYSFTDWSRYQPLVRFTGLQNYQAVIKDAVLLLSIKNSLTYAFATAILQSLIALPVSVLINSKLRFRNGFRTIFFSPAIISTMVVGYLWTYIYSSLDLGLLNNFIGRFGLGPVNWLGNSKLTLGSIIATQVWQWFGWAMVIYLGNLQSIPQELYEAADIDGCGSWRRFWQITLPQLSPSIKINLINGIIAGLKVFDIIYSMTKGGPGHTSETIMSLMYVRFAEGAYGYAASFGIVFLIVTLILTAVMLRLFKMWEQRIG